jgi:hypothetical protein
MGDGPTETELGVEHNKEIYALRSTVFFFAASIKVQYHPSFRNTM